MRMGILVIVIVITVVMSLRRDSNDDVVEMVVMTTTEDDEDNCFQHSHRITQTLSYIDAEEMMKQVTKWVAMGLMANH